MGARRERPLLRGRSGHSEAAARSGRVAERGCGRGAVAAGGRGGNVRALEARALLLAPALVRECAGPELLQVARRFGGKHGAGLELAQVPRCFGFLRLVLHDRVGAIKRGRE